MQKVAICGMNNPHRAGDPLSPDWTAGKKLFQLSGMTREEYEATFERMNLIESRTWSGIQAKTAGTRLKSRLRNRSVIVLGKMAWYALGLEPTEWFGSKGRFTLLPHPSGRCRLYNDESNRRKARECMSRYTRRSTK